MMNLVKEKKGLSIAALVLGLVGLLAWILPIIGLPVGVVGLVLGIVGIKKGARKRAVAGIVLCIISLVLTIANASIGAYMGYKGQLFFQQENVFSLRDEDGNILLEGGVQEAGIVTFENGSSGTSYAVEIVFDETAASEFKIITEEHIGECIGMYVNDEMLMNPNIVTVIEDGRCNVTADSYKDAVELSDLLNSTKM